MSIVRGLKYILLILFIQYAFIIIIPTTLFYIYNSLVFYPGSILIDQVIKALVSFLSVAIWIYQWMWVTNKAYYSMRRK